ncbi:hypothetical protein D9M71_565710 [compost metagenome]
MRVVDSQHGDPGTAGLLHQQLAGCRQGWLGEPAAGIDAHETTGHIIHHRHRLAIDPAAGQGRHITGNTEHAMTVSAVALGAGAVVGKAGGYRITGAVMNKNAVQQGLQVGKGNLRDSSVGACGHLKLPYWIWSGRQRWAMARLSSSDSKLSNVDLMTENIHFLIHLPPPSRIAL